MYKYFLAKPHVLKLWTKCNETVEKEANNSLESMSLQFLEEKRNIVYKILAESCRYVKQYCS